jgi:hypothetical protein
MSYPGNAAPKEAGLVAQLRALTAELRRSGAEASAALDRALAAAELQHTQFSGCQARLAPSQDLAAGQVSARLTRLV